METLLSTRYTATPREIPEDPSYPATEAGQLGNSSIFSRSVSYSSVVKVVNAPHGRSSSHGSLVDVDMSHDSDDDDDDDFVVVASGPEKSRGGQLASPAVKPRRLPLPKPKRWEPIALQAPVDDPDDEFDICGAKCPVYFDEKEAKPKYKFENGEPDLKGEITSCFEESGMLYRVIDKENKTWAFYNDSIAFEVHVSVTFGKHSKIEALDNTTLKRDADGCYVAEVVVYSGETERFIRGFVNGFKSCLRAVPLSDEYLEKRTALQRRSIVDGEINKALSTAGGNAKKHVDINKALTSCIKARVLFVDPDFLPTQSSIDHGAKRKMRMMPWFRPRMYLRPEVVNQVRLFRNKIVPGCVQHGDLGDCWLMCAITSLAESADDIMRLFRHPRGAVEARRERDVGAYRVTLNISGLWHSIVVDDFLPVVAGKPRFARSADQCELWPCLLQKAYAKIYGSYAMIRSGDPMHALTDLTGCPSARFEDAFEEAKLDGGKTLLKAMMEYHREGYQLILITGGRAPAFIPGTTQYTRMFSDDAELEALLGGTGLIPGHAYSVLDVREFCGSGKDIHLVKIRNPWGLCAQWSGPWSPSSAEWDNHAEITKACAPERKGKNITAIWMSWKHVLKYFIGGGVLFRKNAIDYRIPLTFIACRPSFVVEVRVDSPTWVCFILANVSNRGASTGNSEDEEADDDGVPMGDYPPLMMSLSTSKGDRSDVQKVIRNTSVETTNPSLDRWAFVQSREVSMVCKLTPEESPYLLVPRIMESVETLFKCNEWFTQLQGKVHPNHFANRDKSKARMVENGSAEIPVVLGIRYVKNAAQGKKNGLTASFKRLDDSNVVFENFPMFPAEMKPVDNVFFQTRDPKRGFAEDKVWKSIS